MYALDVIWYGERMDLVDVAIIGAGPAGLMCAYRCASAGLKTLLIEKNEKPGRKLLASGAGRCNVSSARALDGYLLAYGDKGRFVKCALLNFSSAALRAFFEERGLPLAELHDGKLFPATERASDVLRALVDSCDKAGATLIRGNPVREIARLREADGGFEIRGERETHRSARVVISCGGASYPATGSTGDGYRFAAALGHAIVAPRPALAAVYPVSYDCVSCAGIALEKTRVTWRRDGKKVGEREGSVLFTHEGLSGPAILDSSRDIKPGDEISLAIAGTCAVETLSARLVEACAASPKKNLKNLIASLGIPEALALVALSRCGTGLELQTGATLSRETRRSVAEALADFRFTVARLGGFGEAMATAGGVDTREVNMRTMESLVVPGLYFAGEVLDVDGDTGGFNLQFAFSSGALAATSLIKTAGRHVASS